MPEATTGASTTFETMLRARRERHARYLRAGWDAFTQDKDNLGALSMFRLAASSAIDGHEAERGALYAATAVQQYALAGEMLRRLLRDGPDVLTEPFAIRERYQDVAEYGEHINLLRRAAQTPNAPDYVRAVNAYIVWREGDRNAALIQARSIANADPDGPFAILLQRIAFVVTSNNPTPDRDDPSVEFLTHTQR